MGYNGNHHDDMIIYGDGPCYAQWGEFMRKPAILKEYLIGFSLGNGRGNTCSYILA